MELALYTDLTAWYHLLDPAEDHADEAACFTAALRSAVPQARRLLDLGAGAGNNASFMKREFSCVLSDISPAMLALSRARNPACEHVLGDMRSLRLGLEVDAVLVHDAICYMTSRADLRAAIDTAFAHLRAGGAALFAPDAVYETFVESSDLSEGEDDTRSLRTLAWAWDPDASDETYVVDYAFLLREGRQMRAVHDRHVEGLFPRQTWIELIKAAGFVSVELVDRPIGHGESDQIFLARK